MLGTAWRSPLTLAFGNPVVGGDSGGRIVALPLFAASGGSSPTRDYGTVQRPTPSADYGGQSIRDVCKGSFFERNICLDQRCEEGRFRSTPECIDVLDRKRKRQSQ